MKVQRSIPGCRTGTAAGRRTREVMDPWTTGLLCLSWKHSAKTVVQVQKPVASKHVNGFPSTALAAPKKKIVQEVG
jgi:hypothetical protein